MTIKKAATWILRLCTLFLIAWTLYYFRHTVLSCHDSFNEFIQARTMTFAENFMDALNFCLARGRAGVIFPFFVAIKRFIEGTCGYVGVWLCQQVPIYANIVLLGYLIGKRTKAFYGWFFAFFFITFLQVDIWHSLIVCYPFDFMYGLFVMIWGLVVYDSWLNHLGEKKNNWRMVLSCFLYYESMQTYEPFITACAVYALLSFVYVYKNKGDKKFGICFWDFCRRLIPHAVIAVVYYGIIVLLHKFPLTEVVVMPIDEHGTLQGFLTTWKSYSLGMFPLRLQTFTGPVTAQFTRAALSLHGVGIAGLAFAGLAAFYYLVYDDIKNGDAVYVKKLRQTLAAISVSGMLIGALYAAPHAFTGHYQSWVIEFQSPAYVPTTICYFGWATFLACGIAFGLTFIPKLNFKINIAVAAVLAICFAVGGYLTSNINRFFKEIPAATGTYMSLHGQTFYAFITDDNVEQLQPDVIYTPGYHGLYGRMAGNDILADYELNYDVTMIPDFDSMVAEVGNYSNPVAFYEDVDATVGIMVNVDDYSLPEEEWTTSEDIYIVVPFDGTIMVTYLNENEDEVVEIVDVKSGEGAYIPVVGSIPVGSINAFR